MSGERSSHGHSGRLAVVVSPWWVRAAFGAVGFGLSIPIAIAAVEAPTSSLDRMLPVWGFLIAGLLAWSVRPHYLTGFLMVLTGFAALAWPAVELPTVLLTVLADLFHNVWVAFVAHLFLAFPSGRLEDRLDRAAVVSVYVYVLILTPLADLLDPSTRISGCFECTTMLAGVLPLRSPAVASAITEVLVLMLAAALLVLLARRWRRASPPARRVLRPVLLAAVAVVVGDLLLNLPQVFAIEDGHPVDTLGDVSFAVAMAVAPFSFLVGLLRTRVTRSSLGQLVADLAEPSSPGRLRSHLARALGDDSLQLGFWAAEAGAYVDEDGRTLALPDERSGRSATLVGDEQGQPLAVLVHDPALHHDEGLVEAVTGAARLALERERLQAELRARVQAVRESRARIVETGDRERRRIERNLHDGAQQRLVALSLSLRMLGSRAKKAGDGEWPERFVAAFEEAQAAVADLRHLAQGLHPSILTEAGLAAAVRALGDSGRGDVDVDDRLGGRRFPEPVELAGYLGVAAVAAVASRSAVELTADDDRLSITVQTDAADHATALAALADRLETVDAQVTTTTTDAGTRTELALPTASPAPEPTAAPPAAEPPVAAPAAEAPRAAAVPTGSALRRPALGARGRLALAGALLAALGAGATVAAGGTGDEPYRSPLDAIVADGLAGSVLTDEKGKPILGADGKPLRVAADGRILDSRGRPIRGADGNALRLGEDGKLPAEAIERRPGSRPKRRPGGRQPPGGGGGSDPAGGGPVVVAMPYQKSATQEALYARYGGDLDSVDTPAAARAVAGWINANGGIGGRPVELRLHQYDGLDGRPYDVIYQEVCHALLEGGRPAAVVRNGGGSGVLTDCMAEKGVPTLGWAIAGVPIDTQRQMADFVFQPGSLAIDRFAAPYVAALDGAGFFGRGTRVGLFRVSSKLYDVAVGPLRQALRRAGADVVEEAAVRLTTSAADVPRYVADVSAAAVRFRAARVNRVVSIDAVGTGVGLFMKAAESQGYTPRYGLSSLNSPQLLQAGVDRRQLRGAVGAGWSPLTDVAAEQEGEPNPTRRQCAEIYRSAGVRIGNRTTAGQQEAFGICDNLLLLRRLGADAMGSARALRTAIESLGSAHQSALAFTTRLDAAHHDGAAGYRQLRFDEGCGCFRYEGGVRAVD